MIHHTKQIYLGISPSPIFHRSPKNIAENYEIHRIVDKVSRNFDSNLQNCPHYQLVPVVREILIYLKLLI